MKRILFLIISISLLAFSFCSNPVFAEMKSFNKDGIGAYFPETDSRIGGGSDNDGALANHGGVGIDFKLGPVVLGLEGKYLAIDRSLKFGDVKPNRAVVIGIGFRF
jgi:hypothetical protein